MLSRLHDARRQIHEVCIDLIQAGRLEQGTPPTAEWILDNEYVIEGNARDVQVNLPLRFSRQLPSLADGPSAGLPRIYEIACEPRCGAGTAPGQGEHLRIHRRLPGRPPPWPSASSGPFPRCCASRWCRASGISPLRTSAELREREIADFWASRLIRANRRGPDQLFAILAELSVTQPSPSPYFAGQLIGHLYDEESALVLVQGWLERAFHQPLGDVSLREQNRQARDQISIGNAFTSLRQLALLDWREIFEHSSRVERLLRADPSGIYRGMDFETRDRYRRIVEELARRSGRTEDEVARRVLALAAAAGPGMQTSGSATSAPG